MTIIERWLERREERRAARSYERRMQAAAEEFRRSPAYARIKACPHTDLRPNPKATAVRPPRVASVCNGCGVGVVR